MPDKKLALVTGAAHRLGKIFALTMAREGYGIFLHYNTSGKEARKTAEEIHSLGMPVFLCKADLSNITSLDRIYSAIIKTSHRLEVVINSAGIISRADLQEITVKDWDLTIDLNLRTPLFLVQKIVGLMNDGGLIVNISDAGANRTWSGYPAYVISKTALESLTRLQAKAYAPHIRVNAIAPGLVLPSDTISSKKWSTLVSRTALGHQVSEDDISSSLIYLLRNNSITGQTLVVDGGYFK
jgi:pteridine reductase